MIEGNESNISKEVWGQSAQKLFSNEDYLNPEGLNCRFCSRKRDLVALYPTLHVSLVRKSLNVRLSVSQTCVFLALCYSMFALGGCVSGVKWKF